MAATRTAPRASTIPTPRGSRSWRCTRSVAAIGETGLDFYRDSAPPEDQRRAFRAHIAIARRLDKPLVIHVRDTATTTDGAALEQTFDILRAEATGVSVVLHCFSGTAERAIEAAERGWYCSFAGNMTYPKAEPLREAAAARARRADPGRDRRPVPQPAAAARPPNQPANVIATAETLAEVREVSYAQLEGVIEANAARLFGW